MRLLGRTLLRSEAYIGGSFVQAESGETLAVVDPATGAEIARVARCGSEETRRAIAAADASLGSWAGLSAKERAGFLRAWYDLIMDSQEDLAQILTAEQGKPLVEARSEIAYGAAFV